MRTELICFSDLHISPRTVKNVGEVLQQITADILDRQPYAVVCVGDIGDFASHNKKSAEFATADTKLERKAVKDVLCEYLFKPIAEYNDRKRALKKKCYKPVFYFCLGNHDRLEHRWLEGFFGEVAKRLNCRINVCDEETLVHFDDEVFFKHTFDKGISGIAHTTCAGILKDLHKTCVQGHRHVREVAEDRDLQGRKIIAICLPCATTDRPDWAAESAMKWDTGWLRLSYGYSPDEDPHYEFMEFDNDRIYALAETC